MSFMNNDTSTNTPSVPSAEPFTSTLPLRQEPSFTNRLIQLPSPVTSGDIPKAVRRSDALSIRCPAPVAVPNLTKKARGRQVPTKEALLKPGTGSARSYSCNVQDCGKVFTRSEHLKRHIRSIHTNEKPFKCEDFNCGKCFTRHDNLLQHQRSHRSPSSISESHSRNSSCDHLSSGPLHRVYTAREPIAPDSAPATLGVLLPSPLSTVPSAAYTTFSVDLVKGKDRITDVSAVDFLSLSTQGSGASVLPQPPYLPCYYGDEHMHTRSVHSPSSMHYQPPFVHISVPIGDTTAKAEPPLEGRKQ